MNTINGDGVTATAATSDRTTGRLKRAMAPVRGLNTRIRCGGSRSPRTRRPPPVAPRKKYLSSSGILLDRKRPVLRLTSVTPASARRDCVTIAHLLSMKRGSVAPSTMVPSTAGPAVALRQERHTPRNAM